jgi:acetyl-CoA acyltransferase
MEKPQSQTSGSKKSNTPKTDRVAVIDAVRTPFVKSFGVFENETALSLSTKIATEIISRTGVNPNDIDECIWGVVVPQIKNANLAREIILFSGLPNSIAGFTLNKACDSSLQSIEIAADRIKLGKNKLVLAGGVEVLSDVPIPFSDEARRFLTKLSKSKTLKEKLSLIASVSPKWFLPKPPSITEPFTGLTMGEHSEIMAIKNNISRLRQDEFAYRSHVNAAVAQQNNNFSDEIVPIWTGKDKSIFVDKDNNVRSDTTVEALSKLRPVFDKKNGTITAGNASPLTDGASVALLSSEAYAKENNLPILGYIVDTMTIAVDPHDQLLIGPAYVIPKLLKKHNINKNDVGVFEIHEAFASQVLSCLDCMESETFCQEKLGMPAFGSIPSTKLNIQGGSISIGHPFGATGARLVGNALRIASRTNSKYAVVAICAAGGMAMGILLETKN